MQVQTDYLALSWSTSRGQDTYGYNIARLDVRSTDQRFKCMGGGYDMVGTVVGEWIEATYQDRLKALRPHRMWNKDDHTDVRCDLPDLLYGLTHYVTREGRYVKSKLDGACGIESMQRIAEALGISMSRTYVAKGRNRGQTTGWMVTDYGSAEAMKAARN